MQCKLGACVRILRVILTSICVIGGFTGSALAIMELRLAWLVGRLMGQGATPGLGRTADIREAKLI